MIADSSGPTTLWQFAVIWVFVGLLLVPSAILALKLVCQVVYWGIIRPCTDIGRALSRLAEALAVIEWSRCRDTTRSLERARQAEWQRAADASARISRSAEEAIEEMRRHAERNGWP